jgi:hypothetical protein
MASQIMGSEMVLGVFNQEHVAASDEGERNESKSPLFYPSSIADRQNGVLSLTFLRASGK